MYVYMCIHMYGHALVPQTQQAEAVCEICGPTWNGFGAWKWFLATVRFLVALPAFIGVRNGTEMQLCRRGEIWGIGLERVRRQAEAFSALSRFCTQTSQPLHPRAIHLTTETTRLNALHASWCAWLNFHPSASKQTSQHVCMFYTHTIHRWIRYISVYTRNV